MPRGQTRDSKGRFAYQGMLSKQQLDCIAHMVYGNEQSPTKIAKEIGVSRASIYNIATIVFLCNTVTDTLVTVDYHMLQTLQSSKIDV